ncbi:glycosyltransferase family 4 protein [Natroniella sulfidigena]|uniref:glycosyltransferase family 4 protein n=1 Tax=Natroniella sulfidigena TaxID=723921 RepID=UPI00200AB927|nr:glycosyltransferase family 4 protein [Natroniella sulfidigena]MCK8817061.1 glycosyltransferase family 4 protein [Natroniella sulfidigena]
MKDKVGILTSNFYDPSGERLIYGGAERYGYQLTKLLLDLDYEVEWWQVGSGWEQELMDGVMVKSIPVTKSPYETMPDLNYAFLERAADIDYAIYFITFLAYPQVKEKSISLSHGIYWDYPTFDNLINGQQGREEWLRRLKIALTGPEKIVSVDTAFIQWVKATWTGLDHKFNYIPNFVDLEKFNPQNRREVLKEKPIRIIYPRRLTTVRGINETIRVAEVMTSENKDLEFHIVGRGHKDGTEKELMKWASKHERIYYYWQSPERMAQLYKQMDIALIPTKAAEGTSLSCLEAMASGCVVISSHVGGLSDLIFNEYNGLLVKPTAKNLIEAISSLLADPKQARLLSQRGIEVAKTFSMKQWRKNWEAILKEVFN